ncbi:MAG: CDP-glucose 4,6-dehydratase, partial [Spirochaetia bacterium]|nr:CDP-glucose 4,6-dehydratase [Spirochaetia bacterium]
MKLFANIYKNKSVFVTGHTGFKGSWLTLWLENLSAKVSGFSLDPEADPNHWNLISSRAVDVRGDINHFENLKAAITEAKPEIVFHLAAQPLVRRSYREPLNTWQTNVAGTANLLEACRSVKSVKAVVVITTDKCYENKEWEWGYRENDRLGGHDPYSASKAACELVVDSYRKSFFNEKGVLIASARAGNVIGGGDWSEDRLLPDLVRAISEKKILEIRSPGATRPWQHVLDPLAGYLLLGQKLLEGGGEFAEAWNFGPTHEGNRTVKELLEEIKKSFPDVKWKTDRADHPHEA